VDADGARSEVEDAMTFWMFIDKHADGIGGLVLVAILAYPGYRLLKQWIEAML
jgi:hypothetical protein